MSNRLDRRAFVMGSLATAGVLVAPATQADARTRRRTTMQAVAAGDERSVTWVDGAGTRSTCHLFTSALGGAPRSTAKLTVGRSIPLHWYTGSLDDGRGTDDGYDALADATRGASWYQARGASVTRIAPAGLDHDDLGGRFGTILAGQLDKHR